MKYKIISFDIFQTLVDVNKRVPDIWKDILKAEYTDEKAEIGARAMLNAFPDAYKKALNSNAFSTMEEVFLECADCAIKKADFDVAPLHVAFSLMFQHSKAPFYDEVLECMKKLHQNYSVILSSDSSHLMVDGLIWKIPHDKAFISDDLKCYKGDKKGRFFTKVLENVDAEPQQILHIGDSTADVIGAKKAGITSCWINRDAREWNNADRPDYIVKDLNGLVDMLQNT